MPLIWSESIHIFAVSNVWWDCMWYWTNVSAIYRLIEFFSFFLAIWHLAPSRCCCTESRNLCRINWNIPNGFPRKTTYNYIDAIKTTMLSKCMLPCIQQAIKLSTISTRTGIVSICRNSKLNVRFQSNGQKAFKGTADIETARRSRSIAYYSISAVVICVGLTYAAVPLYRIFCQVSEFEDK